MTPQGFCTGEYLRELETTEYAQIFQRMNKGPRWVRIVQKRG